MARKKRKTTVYTKQRNRIMSAIRRLKKKGLQTDLYFPTEKELRSQGVKGSELAKLTRELKKYTTEDIRKESQYRQKQEWQDSDFEVPFNQSEDDSFFDRVVITEWYTNLNQYSRGEAYNLLRTWLGNLVKTHGVHDTAEMLQKGAEAGHILTFHTVYNSDTATLYIGYMLDYLPDEGVLYKEEALDRIEYMKRLGDALEQEEDWEYPF